MLGLLHQLSSLTPFELFMVSVIQVIDSPERYACP